MFLTLLFVAFGLGLASPATTFAAGTLTFNPSSAAFGSVTLGTTKTLNVTITNIGTAMVTFSRESLVANHYTVSGFTLPFSLAAGKTMAITIRFAPEIAGTEAGHILFVSDASNGPIQYQLTGAGVSGTSPLIASPATANLGTVPVGTTNSQVIQLKNNGATSLTITKETLTGSSEFKPCSLSYPLILGASKSVNCTVGFAPSAAGSVTGSILFSTSDSGESVNVPLSGQGIAATRTLTLTPSRLNFGSVVEGKSETLTVTLKNTGNSSVVVSAITASPIALSTAGGVQGATIAPGQSAVLDIIYSPSVVGALNGSVSLAASNATGSPAKIVAVGEGISGAAHVVSLSWSASVSAGVAGYNVYRATTPGGGYAKLTSSFVTGTSFSDSTVISGHRYSYEVTAVTSQGQESAPSAPISATIP